MDAQSFLKSLAVFSDLSDPEVASLAADARWIDFAPSAPIQKRGDIGRFLWIVSEGEVRAVFPPAGTAGETGMTLGKGELFGEMSIMTGEPVVADVSALTACRLVRIPRESFSRLLAGNPRTLARFARLITEQMIQAARAVAQADLRRTATAKIRTPTT